MNYPWGMNQGIPLAHFRRFCDDRMSFFRSKIKFCWFSDWNWNPLPWFFTTWEMKNTKSETHKSVEQRMVSLVPNWKSDVHIWPLPILPSLFLIVDSIKDTFLYSFNIYPLQIHRFWGFYQAITWTLPLSNKATHSQTFYPRHFPWTRFSRPKWMTQQLGPGGLLLSAVSLL